MRVTVSTPSRIHFGLFSIGRLADREFGGAGLMLADPRCELEIVSSSRFKVELASDLDAELAKRIETHVRQWQACFAEDAARRLSDHGAISLPKCLIRLHQFPRQHSGLGTGTQLALAVHSGLTAFTQQIAPSPLELILAAERGKRSAIGSYGFFQGGFLVDRGKAKGEPVAPLDFHDNFPDWPIVLALAPESDKVFGEREVRAFKHLPPTPPEVRQRLVRDVRERMVPALMECDFQTFSDAVYQLGVGSGKQFASVQGGIYNGAQVTGAVEAMQDFGIRGVGQSSWGPCVFGMTESERQADELVRFLSQQLPGFDILKSDADNSGAEITLSAV